MSLRLLLLVTVVFTSALTASTASLAQQCNRECSLSERDGRGCCPDKCLAGKVRVRGHCCWPGQKWSKKRRMCTGTPTSCPRGLVPLGTRCGKRVVKRTCPTGQVRSEDSEDNCCWPGQKWDGLREQCAGLPVCPVGYLLKGESCYRAPKRVTDDEHGVVLVELPSGRFSYGCVVGDEECAEDEKENHDYDVESFLITDTEISIAAFSMCLNADSCSQPDAHTPTGWRRRCNWGRDTDESQPVNCVNANQAASFCKWMKGRLPTSIEWEYAAKSGENRVFPWQPTANTQEEAGEKKDKEKVAASCREAVFQSNGPGCGTMYTWNVRSKRAGRTPWGVFDMAGNVAEFTSERTGGAAVLRGGSFLDLSKEIRTTSFTSLLPELRIPAAGFRCVVDRKN